MKKIKYLILTVIMFILGTNNVSANMIKNLDIDIYIDKNGNANVTEVWDMIVSEGTEVYKSMYNLGDREISNFKVRDEKGIYYTEIPWDTSKTLSEKKNKSGINHTDDGPELCWGMGSHGSHTYTINYNLSNVITNYKDAQATSWRLVNDGLSINRTNIDITSYYSFPDTLDVWGYGYEGYAYVKDGKIHIESEGSMGNDEYVVLLAKFESGTFNTTLSDDKTFDELKNQADEGTFEYDYKKKGSFIDKIIPFIVFTISLFMSSIFPFAIVAIVLLSRRKDGISSGDYKFGTLGRKITKEEAGYYRDIPCNKDLFRAYFISTVYGINRKKTDLLGSLLLKWLKEKQIKVITKEKNKLFGGTKEEYLIDLTEPYKGNDEYENELYIMLVEASKDNYLENKEFENWCKNNYSKILNWFDDIMKHEKRLLIAEGKIIEREKRVLKVFKTNEYEIVNDLKKEAIELNGLKNFLDDFTIINEREAIEVTMFEDYLIYAQMFGIAKKVAEQFKKLYPEVIEANPDFDYNSFLILNSISTSGISRATSARSAAESYSSGGGGFSSGGGGGGSFGGGSSGCR